MCSNRTIIKDIVSNYVAVEKIYNVHIDSRLLKKDDIFIAIRGGNGFVEEALEKGAAAVFYDDPKLCLNNPKAVYIEDSVEFIQKLAKEYRRKFKAEVFAITGSNGKTTTKDILYQILSSQFKGKKTKGNYNNHIGLPLTLLRVEDDDEFIVLEMGMSGFGEIDLLCQISSPDYGIITNIGESHLEYLKSKENVFKAKTEILNYVDGVNVFVVGDDPYLEKISDAVKVGETEGNSHIIDSVVEDESGSTFCLDGLKFSTNLLGRHNIKNMSLAILVAEKYGLSKETAKTSVKNIELTQMRYQRIENGNILYINDAYNASPSSVKVSLETFEKFYKNRYKIAVLGDMLELGEHSKKYHEDLAEIIEKSNIDVIYLYGEEMKHLFHKLNHQKKSYFEKKDDISKKIIELSKDKKIAVLLKGSRGMRLEKIIKNQN